MAVLHQGSTDPPATESHPEPSPPPQANQPPPAGRHHPPTPHPNHSPPAVPHQSPTAHPQQPPAAHPPHCPPGRPEQSSTAHPQQSLAAHPQQSPTAPPPHCPPGSPEQSPSARPQQPRSARPEQSSAVCLPHSLSGRPEQTPSARPQQPLVGRPQSAAAGRPRPAPVRRSSAVLSRLSGAFLKRLLGAALGVLLAGAFLVVGYQVRPAPYGDHLTPGPPAHTARARGDVVEAYDGRVLRWRYARAGRRPVGVLPARGEAIALWDDGLVTDTDGRSVRWHRALPAATAWLRARGGAGVLRPLGHGILAVVTPARIAAYRTADGDLRWVLPARQGCAFRPERAVRHGAVLLVAQPCVHGAWTAQLVAVDDLGGVAPHRTPLGNDRPRAGRPEHPRTEKALASPR
ncbi:hypothetical protein [Streptomyces fuscichromogenes]|uniref:Uncharacterized protein n=1 Tax=Streptomyces fuscichromogenes TaxID=1324013 RepID=A0A917UFT0_9ACTN|nr:hypothetical protein [Streptomyces fuscichromogenes]GGM89831.1 hypothetical protein GCM10011578_006950 [Streptomyces fuscichromogenes]